MAQEVSSLLVQLLLMTRRQAGLSSEGLFQKVRFRSEDLLDPFSRIDWDDFTILLDKTLEEIGSEEAYEAAMASTPQAMIPEQMIQGLFHDLQTFYIWLAGVCGRILHTNLQTNIRVEDGGRVVLEHHIPRSDRPSRALAISNAGFFRGATRILGFPDSVMECTFDERCGLYRITPPKVRLLSHHPSQQPQKAMVFAPCLTEMEQSSQFVRVGEAFLESVSLQDLAVRLGDALRTFVGCTAGSLWIRKAGGDMDPVHVWGSRSKPFHSCMLTKGTRILGRIDLGLLEPIEPKQHQAVLELIDWASHAIEHLQDSAVANYGDMDLSKREKQVLLLLVRGLADKEIGLALGTSPKTVGHQVGSLLRKCGAENRTTLANRCLTTF